MAERARWWIAAALLLLAAGAARAQPMEVRRDIAYGPDPANQLDLCLPGGPADPAAAARPGVVVIHGGGWSGGRRADALGLCRAFAAEGIVAANIDYRLAGTPGGAWPAQVQDAQLAIRWLRARAAGLRLDPDRLCAAGNSAGGHIAVFLATARETLPGDRADLLAAVPSAITCAVDNFGPVDFTIASPFRGALVRLAGSADPAAIERLAHEISPLARVGATTAPILICHGDEDDLVPPAQSAALAAALRGAHVKATYLAFPGGHEFKGLPAAQRQAIVRLAAAFILTAPPLDHASTGDRHD